MSHETKSPWGTVARTLKPRANDAPHSARITSGDYLDALTEISRARPLASFRLRSPFDLVRDGFAIALVRPCSDDPHEVEVIDCLHLDAPAFQRSVLKLAKLRQQLARLAGVK